MKAVSTTYEHRKPSDLKNHPLNAQVFGQLSTEDDYSEFVASVKEHGILQPLIITADNVILSGHRRKQAAAKCGIKEVPVIVRHDLNGGLESDFAWFETNRNREMTVEQRAKWYETRVEIETRAAAERQAENLRQVQNVPNGKNTAKTTKTGKAKDIAAADVGIDKRTADKAVEVVHAIEEAEAAGETEKAADLRTTLNTKSVAEAHRKAKAKATPGPGPHATIVRDALDREVPAELTAAASAAAAIQSCANKIDAVRREAEQLAQKPGGDFISTSGVNRIAKQLKGEIAQARFYSTCPRCNGQHCDRCNQTGWIPHSKKGQLSADDKAALLGAD